MKISILCENQTSLAGAKTCLSEWGFSTFIETKNINILFDTGHTDVYLKNAKSMNIDLNTADYIALSHYHWDHVGGLRFHQFEEQKKIVFHPELINKLSEEECNKIKSDFQITESIKALELEKGVFFLGQIPRICKFEKGMYKDEAMNEDTAIAVKTTKGAVVISGCAHAGICNICEYAKQITNQKLYAVIGGFHLFENEKETVKGTISYFKKEKPDYLYPMHCVDFPTLVKFYNEFGITKLSAGDSIEFDD
jgi:7,8-dihydropterin-6-yl-methyl-4-(beta-D-ribofuranosyl)aminobenzene 5'-phosphate synthase